MKALMASSRARRDLFVCILVVILLLGLAGAIDLGEIWHDWSRAHESWEIDELPLVLALGAFAIGWFAIRRWREAEQQRDSSLALEAELEQEVVVHRKVDADLRTQVERFNAAAKSAKLGYYIWDIIDDCCLYCSEEYARLHGLTVQEYMDESKIKPYEYLFVHKDDRDFYLNSVNNSNESQQPLNMEYRIVTKSGEIRHIRLIEHKFILDAGRPARAEGMVQDITDLKRSETLLMLAMNAGSTKFAIYDPDDRLVLANSGFKTLFGPKSAPLSPGMLYESLVRQTAASGSISGSPEQVDAWLKNRLERRRSPAKGFEFQSAAGEWIEVTDVVFDDGYVFTMASHITERKRMEARLQQSQRMQAVGQLTAGLAHDFNNLLGVIHGNAELLGEEGASDKELLAAILKSAHRGAELTHRLLAFSRQQPLRPQSITLSRLIGDMMPQLERTMGDKIEVSCRLPPDLWKARADPGELENALLNLALNARKAMPEGGRLTIECSNVDHKRCSIDGDMTAQDYLRIALADSGVGMEPEVLSRAFEPFFTTEGAMQSSGLGLSMVYGFAKQSGGRISLDSEPGKGTRAILLLPRASGPGKEQPEAKGSDSDDIPQGKEELILLVDDNRPIRAMVRAQLQRLGYRTSEAEGASEAMAALSGQPVSLALVDIVLAGGVSGPAFVAEARQNHPDLKVIFMSGYSAEVAALDPGSRLLTKPFRRHELARALRAALD